MTLLHRLLGAPALVVAIFLGFSASASAAPILYGMTGSGGSSSSLYTIDPTTGATTLIGATGQTHMTGIDFDPTTGIL